MVTENQPPSSFPYDIISPCSVHASTNNQPNDMSMYFDQIIKSYTFLTLVLSYGAVK